MPIVTKNQAVAILTNEVEQNLDVHDLLDIYNELFPNAPLTEAKVGNDLHRLAEPIRDLLQGELPVEELVDFWHLILPKHRNVWYNEEEDRIHYNEESEPQPAE